MTNEREGLISVHLAVLIFGLTALFSKLIELSAVEITYLRSIFAVLAIVIYIKFLKESIQLNQGKDYIIALILGLFLGTHWVTYFHAMQVSSVAIGIIALYTYPVMTVFIEPFFHGELPKFKDIISAFIVLFGVYLLVPELTLENQVAQGVLWGMLSAFLFSMRNILHARYFKHYPARHALMYQAIFIIIGLSLVSAPVIPEVTLNQWILLVVLGIFFTALPHTLFANSLRYLKAKTVSLIGCMQVVYGTFFAAVILSELPSWETVIGGALVISAAVYETASSYKK